MDKKASSDKAKGVSVEKQDQHDPLNVLAAAALSVTKTSAATKSRIEDKDTSKGKEGNIEEEHHGKKEKKEKRKKKRKTKNLIRVPREGLKG